MKIKNIKSVKEFFASIVVCKGSIELVTGDGDRLNLRSTLCQYIAITQMFDEDNKIEWELVLSEPNDLKIIEKYLVF